jgi:nitroreductase
MEEIMDLAAIINERTSTRMFMTRDVPRESIENIIKLAGRAPSALNLQPWEIYVISGEEKSRLSRLLLKSYRERQVACSPKTSRPLPSDYARRSANLPEYLNTYLKEHSISFTQYINEGSCNFYSAPVALIICLDKIFPKDRLVDIGIFFGYFLMAAHDTGLSTCPMGLISEYQDEVKYLLNIPDDKEIVLGLALGYADRNAYVNGYKSGREDINNFVHWIE